MDTAGEDDMLLNANNIGPLESSVRIRRRRGKGDVVIYFAKAKLATNFAEHDDSIQDFILVSLKTVFSVAVNDYG